MPGSFDAALDREWTHIINTPAATKALRRWALRHPALRALDSLADVTTRRPSDKKEPILRALVTEAAHDELAARAVLQAVLPGIVNIGADRRSRQDGAMDDIIGIAWQEIRDFDPETKGWVAVTIVWRTRRRFLRDFSLDSIGNRPSRLTAPTPPPGPEEWALARVSLDAVLDTVASGSVDRTSFDVVVRTRVLGEDLSAVASEHGVSTHAMTMRRLRTQSQLRHLADAA